MHVVLLYSNGARGINKNTHTTQHTHTHPHTTQTGDTWPRPFERLTRNHMKTFTKFVRSIDFNALQVIH